jgi:PIN domain nuclease of toxin-antitoxin system
MNLLLDTHTVIWALSNDPTLSNEARQAIVNPKNLVFVSAVSSWEIIIKKALGKLRAPGNFQGELKRNRFTSLDITIGHTEEIANLPDIHKDPFDRLLIAQAIKERLTIVTRDKFICKYKAEIIKA